MKENKIKKYAKFILEKNDYFLSFYNKTLSLEISKHVHEHEPHLIQLNFGYEALRFLENCPEETRDKLPIIIVFMGHDASILLNRSTYVKKLKHWLTKSNVTSVFVCDFLLKNLLNKTIIPSNPVVVFPGVSLLRFAPYSHNPEKKGKTIFYQLAHFEHRKGQFETIKAFKQILDLNPELNVELILAGGGPLLEACKKYVEDLNLSSHVHFLGWITQNENVVYLNNADVFVHHSLTVNNQTEGIPVAIIEAMAMGLPIISTFHAGIPELVIDGVNGILVNEYDIDAYAKAMIKVLAWGKFLPSNRDRVQQLFSAEKHNASMAKLYNSLIKH